VADAACVEDFRQQLVSSEPGELAEKFLLSDIVYAFPTAPAYAGFRSQVRQLFPDAEEIFLVGSGNWRFSLNPVKFLIEFHGDSDIDVAVVSSVLFEKTWTCLRSVHRDRWYMFDAPLRERLRRNGENIYSGFACPAWIPERGHALAYEFKLNLDKLKSQELAYRPVKMLYFKNRIETIDYYKRGFMIARKELAA
jgi:predicted nucleotidyltransferase